LKVNSSLTTLNLQGNALCNEGASALYEALRYNPTLSQIELIQPVQGYPKARLFPVNSQPTLRTILHTLIGNDGAQVLAKEFRMKFPVAKFN
jgi:hypothetical protein